MGSRWYVPTLLSHDIRAKRTFLAHEFDPDRFIDERLAKYLVPNPFIFVPFNAGPRICLGQQVTVFISCSPQQGIHQRYHSSHTTKCLSSLSVSSRGFRRSHSQRMRNRLTPNHPLSGPNVRVRKGLTRYGQEYISRCMSRYGVNHSLLPSIEVNVQSH
jgi:hypothetical protein